MKSATSSDAFKELRASGRKLTQEQRVLLHIERMGFIGATSSEVEDATKLPPRQVSARINALVKKGLVKDSTLRRRGPYGLDQTAWCPGTDMERVGKSKRDERKKKLGVVEARLGTLRNIVVEALEALDEAGVTSLYTPKNRVETHSRLGVAIARMKEAVQWKK